MNKTLLGLCALAALGLSATAMAGVYSANLNVIIQPNQGCYLSNISDMVMPGYDVGSQNATGQAHVFVSCTSGTPHDLSADNGLHYDNTYSIRRAEDTAGNFAAYQLFQDASHFIEITPTNTMTLPSSGIYQIYGQTDAFSPASTGALTNNAVDTVQLTLNYT